MYPDGLNNVESYKTTIHMHYLVTIPSTNVHNN